MIYRVLSKILVFFLTVFCCLLGMAFIMGIVGCVMIGLYSIGSLLFTGYLDSLMAFYVAADTAFILGGALAVTTMSQCYSYIYDYLDRHVCNRADSLLLNSIAVDPLEHSMIDIKKYDLLKSNVDTSRSEEKSEDSIEEEFECPICFESMLFSDKSHKIQPITLRCDLDEQTYHEKCLLKWMKHGQGAKNQDPIMRVNFNDSALFRYTGYKKTLRDIFREHEKGNLGYSEETGCKN